MNAAVCELWPHVLANPGDSLSQLVLADSIEESGYSELAGVVRRHGIVFGGGSGSGDGGDGGGGRDGGDGGGDGGGGDGGDGKGGYGGGGGGDGGHDHGDGKGGYGGGYDDGGLQTYKAEGLIVPDGLYLCAAPSGYYPWVWIVWVERHDLFFHFRNARIVRRYGSRSQLAVIAQKGPARDTELLEASESEWVPVTSVSRAIPCDPKAWAQHCPKPSVAHRPSPRRAGELAGRMR